MKTTEKKFGKRIVLVDYGQPEYLDGALMQYVVREGRDYLAYFGELADAELFARAKQRAKRPVEVEHKDGH